MKKILMLFAILITLSGITSILAQGYGNITGKVVEQATNDPLPGANILIKSTNFGTSTDRYGMFRLNSVPAGKYEIQISYLGYKSVTKEIEVSSGITNKLDFALEISTVETETVIVQGLRQGQTLALNIQKSADNIKNVVSSDLIGRFPDLNTAEAIARVPGVTIERDQGEGRYVIIRGLSPRLNYVSINGEVIPSPEGDVRYTALDVIPTDELSNIDISKAITPEMDAEAIGGAINLNTKNAFDYDKQVIKATLATGYNNLRSDINLQGAATFATKFGENKNLGFLISANFFNTNRGSDNNEFGWGTDEFDGNEQYFLDDYELRHYTINRKRFGFNTSLDYKFNNSSNLFLRGIWNRFTDQEYRRRLTFGSADFDSPTTAVDGRAERELKDRYEAQDIWSLNAGGENMLGNMKLDYSLSYSYAQEDEPDARYSTFRLDDLNWTYDYSDNDFPLLSNFNQDYNDASLYYLDEYSVEDNITTDKNLAAHLDLTMPISLGQNPGELKFGGKLRNKTKDRNSNVKIYSWDGDDDYLLSSALDNDFDSDGYLDSKYEIGPFQKPESINDFFDSNPDSFKFEADDSRSDTDPASYSATENIYAGYLQGKIQLSNLTTLLGGRFEYTDIDYTGNVIEFNEDGDLLPTTQLNEKKDYSNFFPMIHFKYKLAENTNLRAAATNSISRPNYYDIVPYRIINREDEEIEQGNSQLEPTTSWNFDLMAEHYFQSVGIISGGFFYKNLSDIIYAAASEQSGGLYDGYDVLQPVNGESAWLLGLELNWQQQLTFLPGFLNGFGIYANYTYTKSETEIAGRDEKISLPGQSEHVANFALSYEKYGFTGRVAVNVHGEYISEVGEDETQDIFYDTRTQLDISASYRILNNVQLFAEFVNVSDNPLRYFQGNSDRPMQQEWYSWWSHFGLKLDL